VDKRREIFVLIRDSAGSQATAKGYMPEMKAGISWILNENKASFFVASCEKKRSDEMSRWVLVISLVESHTKTRSHEEEGTGRRIT